MPAPAGAVVVDSFLVHDGRVRDLVVHQERFARSCDAVWPSPGAHQPRMATWFAAAERAVPAKGRWFPRLEAHPGRREEDEPQLVLWVREAPPLTDEVRLWVPPEPDPRRMPRIKGPDLAALAALREYAHRRGADDAILLADDGTVLEAAHSALVWWRGEVLCHPHHELPILPSVTARHVLRLARARGIIVRPERCPWPRLLDAEVWTLNALHGPRPVVGWSHAGREVDRPPADPARLRSFRRSLSTDTSPTPSRRERRCAPS